MNEIIYEGERNTYPIVWEPKPYLVKITQDGFKDLESQDILDLANPKTTRPFIALDISEVQFSRHAKYYKGKEYQLFSNFRTISKIQLLAELDEPNEIFCFSDWQGMVFLFGKLVQEENNVVYTMAKKAIENFVI